jgi:hypothetical protein
MAAVEPGTPGVGLVGRAKAMLLQPDRTWAAIAGEPATANELYRSYVMPLAAIPPVAGLVGVVVFRGFDIAGVGLQPTLATSLIEAVMNYALTLVLVFVMAVVVETVAPMFGGTRSRLQAFKLVAYSGTALWVGGALALIPSLWFLASILGGLYSLYTLYLGLPRLLKVPAERALTCFAVILLLAVILAVLKGELVARIAELGGPLAATRPR